MQIKRKRIKNSFVCFGIIQKLWKKRRNRLKTRCHFWTAIKEAKNVRFSAHLSARHLGFWRKKRFTYTSIKKKKFKEWFEMHIFIDFMCFLQEDDWRRKKRKRPIALIFSSIMLCIRRRQINEVGKKPSHPRLSTWSPPHLNGFLQRKTVCKNGSVKCEKRSRYKQKERGTPPN